MVLREVLAAEARIQVGLAKVSEESSTHQAVSLQEV